MKDRDQGTGIVEKLQRLRGWVEELRTRGARREALVLELTRQHEVLCVELQKQKARCRKLEAERTRENLCVGLPGLAPAEIERLAILAEECGEIVQAVGKVLRFGWQSQSPYGGKTNRVQLEKEIGNLRAIVTLMLDAKDVRLGDVQSWQRAKRSAYEKWTLYQECSMPRDEQLAMIEAIELNATSAVQVMTTIKEQKPAAERPRT